MRLESHGEATHRPRCEVPVHHSLVILMPLDIDFTQRLHDVNVLKLHSFNEAHTKPTFDLYPAICYRGPLGVFLRTDISRAPVFRLRSNNCLNSFLPSFPLSLQSIFLPSICVFFLECLRKTSRRRRSFIFEAGPVF